MLNLPSQQGRPRSSPRLTCETPAHFESRAPPTTASFLMGSMGSPHAQARINWPHLPCRRQDGSSSGKNAHATGRLLLDIGAKRKKNSKAGSFS